VSRIDYIIDNDTNKVYVNEINTIPGSLAFYLWEAKGISFDVLCDRLIKIALKRKQKRDNIIYSNDVNLLSMHSKK
jgi:D-alanine-D-alanine ligase